MSYEAVQHKENDEQVSFGQAVRQGLGRNQGLLFPAQLPKFDDIDALLAEDFVSRSSKILSALIGDELPADKIRAMVDSAFQFAAPIAKVKRAFTRSNCSTGQRSRLKILVVALWPSLWRRSRTAEKSRF